MRFSGSLLFALTTGKDTSDSAGDTVCTMHPGIFRHPRNHALAVASILSEKGRRADYIPSVPEKSKSEARFTIFVNSVASFPGFRATDDIAYHLFLRHGGLDDLQRVVRDAIGSKDGCILAQTMREMMPTSLNEKIEEVILSVLVIEKSKRSDQVTIQLVELALTLVQVDDNGEDCEDEEGRRRHVFDGQQRMRTKVTVPEQMTVMRIQVLEALPRYMAVNAREMAHSTPCTTVEVFKSLFASRDFQRDLDPRFDFGSAEW
ncbi:hypothetical protein DFQ26_006848 [Actinomortierella ambigua]|nr:hypothetical protein DFQ26_006848 [Actinomortierella ambigua]